MHNVLSFSLFLFFSLTTSNTTSTSKRNAHIL